MSKTLAELRANPPKSRPERSVTVCLAPHLVAEVQQLTDELDTLPRAAVVDADGERNGPPRRVGQSAEPPRAAEIRARLAECLDEMAEHEGELRVRANLTDGEWRNWANAHPARDEGQPGYARDQEVTMGYCNADALIDSLGKYAHSWNGDPLTESDWAEVIEPNLGGPDLKQIATHVVAMFESRLDFRQWRSALSANLSRSSASASPATSTSAPADSTAGSPEPSKSATTSTEPASP
ncbi:hypothetical protein LRP67_16230 [Nocardioides sp. cx-169]|uniref:hypothetical protein n=1 Tax=Nocardioides sp. cx-169 TaxID=2899080 RepID=UPI001E2F3F83|nr:hypothetical protein [Nocardioides sp. cx-169]MCD4535641.1 hypothetical protein [Nocardioides sp. cx-169]